LKIFGEKKVVKIVFFSYLLLVVQNNLFWIKLIISSNIFFLITLPPWLKGQPLPLGRNLSCQLGCHGRKTPKPSPEGSSAISFCDVVGCGLCGITQAQLQPFASALQQQQGFISVKKIGLSRTPNP